MKGKREYTIEMSGEEASKMLRCRPALNLAEIPSPDAEALEKFMAILEHLKAGKGDIVGD